MSQTLLPLAGFEVTLNGRFWVTAEDPEGFPDTNSYIPHYVRSLQPDWKPWLTAI